MFLGLLSGCFRSGGGLGVGVPSLASFSSGDVAGLEAELEAGAGDGA